MIDMLEAILRRPRTVLTVMLVILFAGISAYTGLPKESQPSIDIPIIYVSVSQTGVSPSDANRLLVRPLETELKGIEGIKTMTSTATNGHASVVLEFDVNFDKDQALVDTKDRVDRAKPKLPSEADEPTVNEVSLDEFGTITVTLFGDIAERELIKKANALKTSLEGLTPVLEVKMSGDREEVLEVIVDTLKLESYNLTTNQLFDALSRNNLVVPAGSLDTGNGSFALEVPGLIETAADIYNLPILANDDSVITFSDIASIKRTFKDATTYSRINGRPAITLIVTKRLGSNIIDVSTMVRETTETAAKDWPSELQHGFMIDQSKIALDMFTSLQSAVLTAVALVLIVSVALLGIRPALLIGFSIPVSFMMSFFFLQLMGLTINMMIMFGLVLTVGMLVDGAIVVVEYAERKIAEGLERREAFIRAARMMFWPIVSSTGTTLAAFLPLLLWPGIVGKFMSYLPIMVIATLIASLITAMIFLPVVGSFVARKKVSEAEQIAAQRLAGGAHFDPKEVKGFLGGYVRMMAAFMHNSLTTIVTLVVGFASIVFIFVYFAGNSTGVVAFPETEPDYGTIAVTTRGNYSPIEIRDLLIEVEEIALTVSGIEDIAMNFGSTGAVGDTPNDTVGNLQLEFAPFIDRRRASEIFAEITEKTKDISGIGVEIVAAEDGPPVGKDINLRVEADTYEELTSAVASLRNFVENDLGDMINVEDTRPLPGIDWEITVDRDMAARFGIGVRELSPYVQLVTNGVMLGTYRPEDATDEIEIRARLPREQRSFDELDQLTIVTNAGPVPVSNFITRKAVQKVADISRQDGRYYMTVAANVDPMAVDAEGNKILASSKVPLVKEWLVEQNWPEGIDLIFGGADEQTQETNDFMAQAGMGALFLMFLILLTQFNSFYQVFVTLSTVIMSTAGVLLGMLITGQAFSAIMTGIGIVSLAGIVVNNAIVLIDTYNRLRKDDDVDDVTAILMTVSQRMRPVMLTTITTVFGLLPMAIGLNIDFFTRVIEVGAPSGDMWISLSTALVSGLSFSTILTLVMVPVMLVAPGIIWKAIRPHVVFVWNKIMAVWNGIKALLGFKKKMVSGEKQPDHDKSDSNNDNNVIRHAAE